MIATRSRSPTPWLDLTRRDKLGPSQPKKRQVRDLSSYQRSQLTVLVLPHLRMRGTSGTIRIAPIWVPLFLGRRMSLTVLLFYLFPFLASFNFCYQIPTRSIEITSRIPDICISIRTSNLITVGIICWLFSKIHLLYEYWKRNEFSHKFSMPWNRLFFLEL